MNSNMNNSLPYKVLYATGNERCRKCNDLIQSRCLQIAIMDQSDKEDCHYAKWYHQSCFFKIRLPQTEAAFDGFALLRYTDQLAIKENLGTIECSVIETIDTEKLPDFGVEYTRKQARDLCAECTKKLNKGEIRIKKVIYDLDKCATFDSKILWYHFACFARLRFELNWWHSAESLPGYQKLNEEDKEMLSNIIPVTRRVVVPVEASSNVNLIQLESQIEAQNVEYYRLYDYLQNVVLEADQKEILFANHQILPKHLLQTPHHLADIIYFGALNLCKKCGTGQLVFNNSTYSCTHATAWDRCDNEMREPERSPIDISLKMLSKYPLLAQYTATVRTRALNSFRLFDESGNDLVYGPYREPPLFNMEFVIIGSLQKPSDEIKCTIQKLGGKLVDRVHSNVAAVISTADEVERMESQMQEAKAFDIQVVSVDFLTAVTSNIDPVSYIVSESLCDWGGSPYERVESGYVAEDSIHFYRKLLPEVVTYKWKYGIAVDPECHLDDFAHVYCEKFEKRTIKFSAILGLVDIQQNKNSFYRMQLLESDKNEQKYWVFESWGRISTIIGSNRLTSYDSLEEARHHFNFVYEEKTGNYFGSKQFFKQPNKFYHLDVEMGKPKEVTSECNTKLNKSVHELMKILFDYEQIENVMLKCKLDLKQMPLGKMSAAQIQLAMTILKEIFALIQCNGTIGQLRAASNRFYTLIPHAFYLDRPTVIDSIEMVAAKTEMLESLSNFDLIYDILSAETGEEIDPFDGCYLKLKTEILPIDKNSLEFQFFCSIVRNTHGITHNNYTLEVLDIFKVERHGEDKRFHEFQHLKYRALLWHGSRLTNFASILTNGLKVQPSHAPQTSCMFGKGIYFADVVSKAANYCRADATNNIGLMSLCEVALGDMKCLRVDSKVTDIPNETWQSVKGCGVYVPRNWSRLNGTTMVPTGEICAQDIPTKLLYNEYVVYEPSQIKIKYLFKMKFHPVDEN